MSGMNLSYEEYRDLWAAKTVRQIEREIESWRKYMQRHTRAYAWHGSSMTPPGELSDGDKLCALRDALKIAQDREADRATCKERLQVAALRDVGGAK